MRERVTKRFRRERIGDYYRRLLDRQQAQRKSDTSHVGIDGPRKSALVYSVTGRGGRSRSVHSYTARPSETKKCRDYAGGRDEPARRTTRPTHRTARTASRTAIVGRVGARRPIMIRC